MHSQEEELAPWYQSLLSWPSDETVISPFHLYLYLCPSTPHNGKWRHTYLTLLGGHELHQILQPHPNGRMEARRPAAALIWHPAWAVARLPSGGRVGRASRWSGGWRRSRPCLPRGDCRERSCITWPCLVGTPRAGGGEMGLDQIGVWSLD